MSWKGGGYGGKSSSKGSANSSYVKSSSGNNVKPSTSNASNRPQQPSSAPTGSRKQPCLTVSSNAKKDEIGVQTLLGDYIEVGTNHDRKYYKKSQEIPGHKDVKVFLYYWDMRDGSDFSGWWFGDELGGSQVWARCSSHGNVPPSAGWKIPWDAMKSEPGLLTVNEYRGGSRASGGNTNAQVKSERPERPQMGRAPAADSSGLDAKVNKLTKEVDAVESVAKGLITKAKQCKQEDPHDNLQATTESLKNHQTKLSDLMKRLTSEISEGRKSGPSAVTSVTELSKLSPRLRSSITSLTAELNKIKGWITNMANKEAFAKKAAANLASMKETEDKQSKEVAEALPATWAVVKAAQDAVETIQNMARPIIDDPPDEADGSLQKLLDQIEKNASEAQEKVTEARQLINQKLQDSRQYAPETRKKALSGFTELQGKLGDTQKTLNPLKSFRREFADRVAAKKALVELAEKLASAELEVEKAAMMSPGHGSQMSEEDVESAEGLVKPAQSALRSVQSLIEQKMRESSGPMKDELDELKKRLAENKTKVDEVASILKAQREGLTLQSVYATAIAKVDKVEEVFANCGEAELPFLKGIEVLPKDESDVAIKESETAITESTKTLQAAESYIKKQLVDIRRFSKETIKSATAEFDELQKRLDVVVKKLSTFKNETKERKITAIMAEAVESVVSAEKKCKSLQEVAKVFESDNLEDTSVAALREAAEKTTAAAKECSSAVEEARKVVSAKQKESREKDLTQSLSKLTSRINTVQGDMSRARKAAASAEKLVNCKEALSDGETKLAEVDVEVEKLEKIAKPDQDLGLGDEKIDKEALLEMEKVVNAVTKGLKAVASMVSSNSANAPAAMKGSLAKLSDKCKVAQSKIDDVKKATKDQREQVMSEAYVKEAEELAKAAEVALEKSNDAESPYLKGIEPSLEEAQSCLADCDKSIAEIQKTVSDARNLIAEKNLEMKKYDDKNSKSAIEEFGKLSERVNTVAQKLGVFKKDTDNRRKKTLIQEAVVRVSEMEAEVAKVTEQTKPMVESNADELSAEEASRMVKSLEELEKSAQTKVNDCRSFLAARARDAKDEAEKTQIKDLQSKLADAQNELRKAKKLGHAQTEKIRAKALLQEANEKLKEVEGNVEKTNSACAALIDEKGERFLVKNSIETLAAALSAHMSEKSLGEEDMWKEMGSPLDEAKFVEFVGKIPEAFKREECAFSEERRRAMFKSVDADGDAAVSLDEFKSILSKRFECVQGIAVTDIFDIAASKTLCKIEKGELVQTMGPTKTAGEGGVPRVQCKILSTGEEGWITMQGNGGTTYLEATSVFKDYTATLSKTFEAMIKANLNVSNYFGQKIKELGSADKDSPLHAAKEEISKTRSKVSAHIQNLDNLKKKVEQAKTAFYEAEKKEKNAHIEAKERKEADAILDVARPQISKMEAELKKLDTASIPLLERKDTDLLEAFTTPLTVLEEVSALEKAIKALAEEAKVAVKAQQEQCGKASKGPMLDAKKELNKWMSDIGRANSTCNKVLASVQKCCTSIATSKFETAAAAMRSWAKSQELALDDYFTKLAEGADKISEDSLCKHVQSLEGMDLSIEQAKLLVRRMEDGGVGRRAFLRTVQRYYKVVKDIAITPSFDVVGSKDKPVRKAEMDEVLEVIEGPKTDSKSALQRVKVRALVDAAEGWVSITGNQGKVFLEEDDKPFVSSLKELRVDKDFSSSVAEDPIRKLKVDEVIEVLEGPRKEVLANALRLRVKHLGKDEKIGWVTVKDRHGNELVAKDEKSYTCVATVAITDNFDIKSCKVLKKLAENEVFDISEGPVTEETSGITRVKGKSAKDGAEGWVTVTGNAGTVYCKVNDKLWRVKKEVVLTEKMVSDSPEIRTAAEGDLLESFEKTPKEDKLPAIQRLKIRTSPDSVVGWITVKSDTVKKWTDRYRFSKAGNLYSKSQASEELLVRKVESGETAETVEGPVEVEGRMWLKGKMKKDGAIGWSPFRDAEGNRLLSQ